jgi:hypothetical protein
MWDSIATWTGDFAHFTLRPQKSQPHDVVSLDNVLSGFRNVKGVLVSDNVLMTKFTSYPSPIEAKVSRKISGPIGSTTFARSYLLLPLKR